MIARIVISCHQCGKRLGFEFVDTADMPDVVQEKINKVILAHREDCKYYRSKS